MIERTLAIIKPDAVGRNLIGKILARIEAAGLRPIAMKMAVLSVAEAEGFYHVHKGKPFFTPLVEFMTSGPVVLMVLEGEGAIARWREVMGATDPAKAAPGTIRKEFAQSIQCNAAHGSDAPETAAFETCYFFSALELCPRP
jgi:nucleoside-diphosphate kinase